MWHDVVRGLGGWPVGSFGGSSLRGLPPGPGAAGLKPRPPQHVEGGKAQPLHSLTRAADVPGSLSSSPKANALPQLIKSNLKQRGNLYRQARGGNEATAGAGLRAPAAVIQKHILKSQNHGRPHGLIPLPIPGAYGTPAPSQWAWWTPGEKAVLPLP